MVHIAQHITTCRSEAARAGSGFSVSWCRGTGDLRRFLLAIVAVSCSSVADWTSAHLSWTGRPPICGGQGVRPSFADRTSAHLSRTRCPLRLSRTGRPREPWLCENAGHRWSPTTWQPCRSATAARQMQCDGTSAGELAGSAVAEEWSGFGQVRSGCCLVRVGRGDGCCACGGASGKALQGMLRAVCGRRDPW